jgi:xylulokinase
MPCVLGLDIGTTSTIAILIDTDGRTLALASRPVTLSSLHPGWAEEDPEQWWGNVCALIPAVLDQARVPASAIRAIGVTGMLPAMVLLDADGGLLRPSIQQSDARCGEQVQAIAADIDEAAFLARTGNGINQQLVASRLRWVEQHEPAVFSRIRTVFGSYDFINWRLTGERAIEQNWALEAGFVDLGTMALSDELIALGHVSPRVIPPKIASHALLGRVTAAAAAQTGLAVNTPVIGGAADHVASAYAAGVLAPGDVLLKFGGSTDILLAATIPRPDRRLFLDHHLVPGLFMPNGCMANGGSALNWFIRHFAAAQASQAHAEGRSAHAHLDALAAPIPAGADGVHVLPHFLGEKTPIHDPAARGALLGLSLNHDTRHVWRALLESFAYAFRHHVAVFNDIGLPTTRFLASDGGAQSALWMQICADVLGAPVQTLTGHPGSCLGVAWLAAIGSGLTRDWAGVSAFVSAGAVYEPRVADARVHDAGYQRYRASYEALAAIPKAVRA